jgi:hypothetical protein
MRRRKSDRAGFLNLLAPVQTAIAAVDAVLAEPVTTERGA